MKGSVGGTGAAVDGGAATQPRRAGFGRINVLCSGWTVKMVPKAVDPRYGAIEGASRPNLPGMKD
jgi:hypothetical protein